MAMTVGSLFSGIGGLDLGLEWSGFEVAWQCENEPYAARVLRQHWPHVPNLGDVTKINWEDVPYVDVIAGGYPCQPFSIAGFRDGDSDARHLWPYFADAIRRIRPRYALLENVSGHLSLGFGRVLADLARIGYDCRWDGVQASSLGAPHQRKRLFAIAYRQGYGLETRNVLDTPKWRNPFELRVSDSRYVSGHAWETGQPPFVGVDDGISDFVDRSKGLGNAVVPQVAQHIGKIIQRMEAEASKHERQ